MWSFFILALCGLVGWSSGEKCPPAYERLTLHHTFCIPRNPKCDIKHSDVTPQDIAEILKVHNQYRSDLALGKETRAKDGTLPKAADMLQMVWDEELAAIAQKWAENCLFDHDCDTCSNVPNFQVGQNLALTTIPCSNCEEAEATKADWADSIKGWYEELLMFEKGWLDNFQGGRAEEDVEHFTQMIWSKTWRIGCGYTAYKEGEEINQLYVCNYGPSGNVLDQPVYKQAEPCSACPVNTCCGSSCKTKPNYPGLCQMLDPNTAPIYERNLKNLLFFCDSNPKTKDCETQTTGADKWTNKATLEGNYMSIILDGGESTTLEFKRQIDPTTNEFCIRIVYRKGPMRAGEKDASSLKAVYKRGNSVSSMDLTLSELQFTPFRMNIGWKSKTSLSLTFSVPQGAQQHILDVKEIMAFDGKCKSRQDI